MFPLLCVASLGAVLKIRAGVETESFAPNACPRVCHCREVELAEGLLVR